MVIPVYIIIALLIFPQFQFTRYIKYKNLISLLGLTKYLMVLIEGITLSIGQILLYANYVYITLVIRWSNMGIMFSNIKGCTNSIGISVELPILLYIYVNRHA